jgi:hypothetical protein
MRNSIPILTFGVAGHYVAQRVRNNVVLEERRGKNLVTNKGLDNLCNGTYTSANGGVTYPINYCYGGTGSTTPANTDTALAANRSSTNTYLGAGSGVVNDTVSGTVAFTRVFNFAAEGSSATYAEAGVSHSSSTGNLFSRWLLSPTLALNSGDNLRITYTLVVSIPILVSSGSVSLTSSTWDGTGNIRLVGLFNSGSQNSIFGTLSAAGAYTSGTPFDGVGLLGAAGTIYPYLIKTTTSFPSVNATFSPSFAGSSQTDSQGSASWATYTTGNYYRDCTVTFPSSIPAASSTSGITGVFVTSTNSASPIAGLLWLFNSAQTKSNTKALSFVYRVAWSR